MRLALIACVILAVSQADPGGARLSFFGHGNVNGLPDQRLVHVIVESTGNSTNQKNQATNRTGNLAKTVQDAHQRIKYVLRQLEELKATNVHIDRGVIKQVEKQRDRFQEEARDEETVLAPTAPAVHPNRTHNANATGFAHNATSLAHNATHNANHTNANHTNANHTNATTTFRGQANVSEAHKLQENHTRTESSAGGQNRSSEQQNREVSAIRRENSTQTGTGPKATQPPGQPAGGRQATTGSQQVTTGGRQNEGRGGQAGAGTGGRGRGGGGQFAAISRGGRAQGRGRGGEQQHEKDKFKAKIVVGFVVAEDKLDDVLKHILTDQGASSIKSIQPYFSEDARTKANLRSLELAAQDAFQSAQIFAKANNMTNASLQLFSVRELPSGKLDRGFDLGSANLAVAFELPGPPSNETTPTAATNTTNGTAIGGTSSNVTSGTSNTTNNETNINTTNETNTSSSGNQTNTSSTAGGVVVPPVVAGLPVATSQPSETTPPEQPPATSQPPPATQPPIPTAEAIEAPETTSSATYPPIVPSEHKEGNTNTNQPPVIVAPAPSEPLPTSDTLPRPTVVSSSTNIGSNLSEATNWTETHEGGGPPLNPLGSPFVQPIETGSIEGSSATTGTANTEANTTTTTTTGGGEVPQPISAAPMPITAETPDPPSASSDPSPLTASSSSSGLNHKDTTLGLR